MNAAILIWKKLMRKFFTNPEESIGMLIQPILWVVLFGIGMKGLMGPNMPGGGNGYIAFIVPGIISLTALGGSIAGGLVWLDERTKGIVKEYLVAPVSRMNILIGYILSIISKSMMQSIVILLIGIPLGAYLNLNPIEWILGFIIVTGYITGFSGIALAMASKTDDPGAYHSMIFLLNLPLLFLSNALYPMDALPKWMQIGALLNPTSYVVDGLRQTILSDGTVLAGGEALPLLLCILVPVGFALL